MTIQEFNERTGMNLSQDEYGPIEKMYVEAGNIHKDLFCSDYKVHKDSILLNEFYAQSVMLKEQLDALREERKELAEFIAEQADICGSGSLREKAIRLMGKHEYLLYKIKRGDDLWSDDMDMIADFLEERVRYNIAK